MQKTFYPGLKKIRFALQKARDFMDTSKLARVMFVGDSKTTTDGSEQGLVHFLRQVFLFTELSHGELRHLARIVHERVYQDGEIIFEQGTPGAALYLLRDGSVEVTRTNRNREEIPLATLEPPASFEELSAVGAEVVHWASARAHGPVSLVAIGRSDLDSLSHDFPRLAIKLFRKLGQIIAVQLQMLLEAEYFDGGEERE